MIKLVIWDLDGILWSGSIGERFGIGTINTPAIDFIIATEKAGIIHSIASKNNFNIAKEKLIELGIWEYFVFPQISYESKGITVKDIITNCQLREENVLFVDDNSININEVIYYNPKINTAINTDFIKSFTIPNSKSRTNFYKILEEKSKDRNNIDFLQNSDITLCFLESAHFAGVRYFDRVTELVNRSNQLNFTDSRIPANHINLNIEFPYEFLTNKSYIIVFAWDKYGYYGVIGYISVAKDSTIVEHFVFSCRVLGMNIENFCSQYIEKKYGWKQCYTKPVDTNGDYSYIKLLHYNTDPMYDLTGSNYINEQEGLPKIDINKTILFDAGCYSELFSILSKLEHNAKTGTIVEYYPKKNENINVNLTVLGNIKYYVWSIVNLIDVSYPIQKNTFIQAIETVVRYCKKKNIKVLIILPKDIITYPNVPDSYKKVLKFILSLNVYRNVVVYEGPDNRMTDQNYKHWNRKDLLKISDFINTWYWENND